MTRLIFLSCFAAVALQAHDWPQLLGPNRNGVSDEAKIGTNWGKPGPRILWQHAVGQGWSAPVVASNRVVFFHRLKDREAVECVDALSGTPFWKADYATDYRDDFGFDEGPRATPAISGIRVFTFGANGVLSSWNLTNGAQFWRIDTRKEFNNDKGFFGIACSPLVEGDAVILNLGGAGGAGIVAFDAAGGRVLWKVADDEASYSSPVAATFGGKRRVLVLTRGNLVALDPASGRVLWIFPFKPTIHASVSAATPLVMGDLIFISGSYGAGAAMLRFSETKPEVLWRGDDILSNHYATSVAHDGYLFGFDGRQEQKCNLRSVDAKSGKVRWSEDRFGAGTILRVQDQLVILTERGELIVASASEKKFAPIARAQILGLDCRAHAAFANGLLYARDKNKLVCVDLRAAPGK